MTIETIENQEKDSDMIFTAISTGSFDNYTEAEQAVVSFYVMDLSISRCGISHTLKRLKEYYGQR